MEIAKTILEQLGGNKFLVMTGSKNLLDLGNGLRMNLARNASKAKWLKIELKGDDTYTMTFFTANKYFDIKNIAVFEGVYFDQLQPLFTKITGMYTSLGTMAA